MSVRTDNVNLIVSVNGSQAQKQLFDLDQQAYNLRQQMKGMKKDSEEWNTANQSLKEMDAQMSKLRETIGLTGLTQKQLNDQLKELQRAKQYLTPGSDAFNDIQQKINDTSARLKAVKSGTDEVGIALQKTANDASTAWGKFKDIALGVLTGNIVSEIGSGLWQRITGMITGAGKLSDSLADIQRVSGMTAEEVKKLNGQLTALDTRTSMQGLRDIAVVAGKLGIAKEDVLDFVKATDKLTVALGDELGNSEQITTDLGRLINVFSKDGKVTGDRMMYIGNAIVHMANAGTATGDFIVEFTQRLSGLAKTANLSLPDVIGMGAGLQELGQKSENSSTAVVKALSKIALDVPTFAKIAGKSVEEFSATLRDKPVEALIKVSEGLVKGRGNFEKISQAFKDAGEDSARIVSTLGVIGGKADFMRQKIEDAGTAMGKQNEITGAFNLKNEDLGALLDKIGKKFNKLATSPDVVNFMGDAARGTYKFLQALSGLPGWLQKHAGLMIAAATATGLYYANTIQATYATIAQTLAEQRKNIALKASAAWESFMITQLAIRSSLTAALTGEITLATAAQEIYNVTMAANPIGAVIVLLGALAFAFAEVYNNSARVVELEKLKHDMDVTITKTTNDLTAAQEKYNGEIQNYSKLSLQQRNDLQTGIDLKIKDAEATLQQLEAQRKLAAKDAAAPGFWEAAWNGIKNGGNMVQAELANMDDAAKNSMEVWNQYGEKIDGVKGSLNNLKKTKEQLNEITQAETKGDALTLQTVAQLTDKVNYYRTALDNAVKGSEDFLRIQKKLADAQKNLDAMTPNSISKEEAKKIEDGYAALMHDINALNKEGTQDQIEAVTARYAELTARANKFILNLKERATVEAKIEAEKHAEILKIQQEGTNKKVDEILKGAELESQKQMDAELEQLVRLNATNSEDMQTDLQKAKEMLQKEHLQRLVAAYKVFGRDTTELEKQIAAIDVKNATDAENAKIDAAKKSDAVLDKIAKGRESKDDKAYKHRIRLYQEELRFTDQVANSMFKVWDNAETQKKNTADKNAADAIAKEDAQLKAGTISQQKHDDDVAAIQSESDARTRKYEHDAAIRAKAQSMFQAGIKTAEAILQINANPAVNDDITQSLRTTLIAFATGIGIAEEAEIASTPIPALKDGIIGIDGPGTSTSDSIPSFLSKGESVMTAKETELYGDYLRQMRNRTFQPNWFTNAPQQMNIPLVQQGVSVSKWGNTSMTNTVVAAQQNSSNQNSTGTLANDLMLLEIKGMRDDVKTWQKNLKAYFVFQEYSNDINNINAIKNDAKTTS